MVAVDMGMFNAESSCQIFQASEIGSYMSSISIRDAIILARQTCYNGGYNGYKPQPTNRNLLWTHA